MAAMLIIGIAEVAVGLAGLGLIIPGLLPEKPADPSHTTVVRVGAGMHGLAKDIKDTSAAGNFPDVQLFDGAGRLVGRNGGKNGHPHVDAGGFKEVTISHEKGMDGVGSEYMALSASGNDAICINWVTVAWPSGEHFGFLGDLGTMCGADWYYSDTLTANWDSSSNEAPVLLNRTSNCVWLDGNGSNGLRYQGLGIHLLDFSSSKDSDNDGRAKQYHANPETMCSNAPRLKMYKVMDAKTQIPIFWPKLSYNTDNSDLDLKAVTKNNGMIPSKRRRARSNRARAQDAYAYIPYEPEKAQKRSSYNNGSASLNFTAPASSNTSLPFLRNTLVKSPYAQHTATHLCNNSNSAGPDFVSLAEGIFCDMAAKLTWPICSKTVPHACFDLDTNQMRLGALGRRSINGRQIPDKSYTEEVKWGSG